MSTKQSKNLKAVLEILRDEVKGDVSAALRKMTKDYTMTWMYQSGKEVFPSTKIDMEKELEEVYPIKGRQYDIRNIAEGKGVVMIELIESYPDPETKKVYRTPLVLVLEMRNGKIKKGRHYTDPRLSFMYLKKSQIEKGLKKTPSKKIIK